MSLPAMAAVCLPGYSADTQTGEVWFHTIDDNFRVRDTRIFQADASTFFNLNSGSTPDCPIVGRFAKDKKNVYFDGRVLRFALPTDVEPLVPEGVQGTPDFGFVSSNGNILFGDCLLEKVDRTSFKVDQMGLAHDANAIFAGCQRFPAKSVARKINSSYFTVGEKVFFQGAVTLQADAKTFEGVGLNYGRDQLHLFFRDQILNNRDAHSFKFIDPPGLDEHYNKDRTGVYFNNRTIGGDPGTFHRIDPTKMEPGDPKLCAVARCSADKDRMFVENPGRQLAAGQVGASEVISALRKEVLILRGGYQRFGAVVFFEETLVPGVDAKSFVVLDDYGFAKDKGHLYCRQFHTNFDPYTFMFWPRAETACGKDRRYIKDSRGVYLIAGCDAELFQRVEGADPATFEAAGNPGCARDVRQVYRCGTPLKAFAAASSCGLK